MYKTVNKKALLMGKWRIMPAPARSDCRAREIGDPVFNNDEVFLEQDWFYIIIDSGADRCAVLKKQLPGVAQRVERRAIWRLRITATRAKPGPAFTNKNERTLARARIQLDGLDVALARGGEGIKGGHGFAGRLRAARREHGLAADAEQIDCALPRLRRPGGFYRERWATGGGGGGGGGGGDGGMHNRMGGGSGGGGEGDDEAAPAAEGAPAAAAGPLAGGVGGAAGVSGTTAPVPPAPGGASPAPGGASPATGASGAARKRHRAPRDLASCIHTFRPGCTLCAADPRKFDLCAQAFLLQECARARAASCAVPPAHGGGGGDGGMHNQMGGGAGGF